jgi:hypothetical protein
MKTDSIMRKLLSITLAVAMAAGQLSFVGTATALSIPSASSVMNDVQKRYHINTGSVQNFGESFNVASTKKYAPELSISFSPTDPKEGQKVTAKAFPMYFSNPPEQLYYTWYLKRKDGSNDVEDWKTEAMRIIANDGADTDRFLPGPNDEDGYRAEHGGGDRTYVDNDWCYIRDPSNGNFYELGPLSSSPANFTCGTAGYQAACISQTQNVGSDNASTYPYKIDGSPVCQGNTPVCPDGSLARCVNPTVADGMFSLSDTIQRRVYPDTVDPDTGISTPNYVYDPAVENNMTCQENGEPSTDRCMHLFPNATGHTTGDGSFGADEERYWMTNPSDADTADNGNKDEANIVGLGRDTFTWNYQSGDMLGLVVEGVSMVPTKHDDSTMMIMWAFSGDGCRVTNTGSYNATIKGYSVNIPTTSMGQDDFDQCLEDNLIDPLNNGQQNSKKIELDVVATPDNPTNDQTGEKWGDTVTAVASIMNSNRSDSEVTYEWQIEVSDNANMSNPLDVTDRLREDGLLPISRGNGLKSISFPLNMEADMLGRYATDDPLYMRLTATATENFNARGDRSGHSDVIVRVNNTDKKILAYVTEAVPYGSTYKMTLSDGNASDADPLTPICRDYHANAVTATDATDNLDRIACRIIKNEIIGVRVDNSKGEYRDFKWTIDGKTLSCNASVSDDADCVTNGNEAFFAVVGAPGTIINVRLDALNVATGRTVSLTRVFNVVEPEIVLESAETEAVWPRFVGQFTDINGASFDEYSSNFFEKYPDSGIRMQARFVPSFAQGLSTRTWTIDDVPYPGETIWNTPDGDFFGVEYVPAELPIGTVFNVGMAATIVQPVEKRRALRDIWGIDESQSAEVSIGKSIQVQNVADQTTVVSGVKKFYAALAGYIPPMFAFAFRIFLSGGLLLFAVAFAFSFVPEGASAGTRRK